ncbi:MAG: hypothetical protein IJ371_06455 [Clostridia bacterium]|nr:hypothetical protein [Clostridia bacterium]
MITNTSLTIYHKVFNETTRLEEWRRYNYYKVWWFGGKGSSINKGYDNANDVNVRIPYLLNNINIANIQIGDILVKGDLATDITTQQDLVGYEVYNITSINDNDFGNNPHLHIGGK